MPEQFSWTASLGRWFGVPVRLHVLFVLVAALVFAVEWNYVHRPGILAGTALATVLILLASVLIHELAHIFASSNLGGQVDEVTLTPWGGDSRMYLPPSHHLQLIVHSAGPFANLVIFAIGAILLTKTGNIRLDQLVDPLRPHMLVQGAREASLLKIVTWINFQLFLINLLPVFPFDAHKILRSAVWARNPKVSRLKLESALMFIGIGAGLMMLVFAWLLRNHNSGPLQPAWFMFVCAGVIFIFSARYGFHQQTTAVAREWDLDEEFNECDNLYEEDDMFDFDMEDETDSISQWLQEKQESREQVERTIEQEEERRVDRILEKLHRDGIESLSDEERTFLNRISARYRRRRQLPS